MTSVLATLAAILRRPSGAADLAIVVLHVLIAIVAPLIVPHDPALQDSAAILQAPSTVHLFGTDRLGRDVFSRTLLGGRDKDLPWADLVNLAHQRVDHVIVFGEAAPKILHAFGQLRPGARLSSITRCDGLQAAVLKASQLVKAGDVVLLSPGGTSFDEFKDFEERGERFKTWVNQLS